MEFTRETLVEIASSFGPVLVMLAAFVVIGVTFSDPETGITPTGGKAFVAAIAVFVLVMAAIGIYLARSGHGED